MKPLETRFRAEFSLLTFFGFIVEIVFIVIMCLLGNSIWYLTAIFLLVPFGLVRSLLLILACMFDCYPWMIASVETLAVAPIFSDRKPNIIFRMLGFTRNTSFVRALCYTRDFRGFYGRWCLFSKLIHHGVFLVSYIITIFFYIIIPDLHHQNFIRRLVIIELCYLVYTTYFDHLVVYRILSLRSKAAGIKPQSTITDPVIRELLSKIEFV